MFNVDAKVVKRSYLLANRGLKIENDNKMFDILNNRLSNVTGG